MDTGKDNSEESNDSSLTLAHKNLNKALQVKLEEPLIDNQSSSIQNPLFSLSKKNDSKVLPTRSIMKQSSTGFNQTIRSSDNLNKSVSIHYIKSFFFLLLFRTKS